MKFYTETDPNENSLLTKILDQFLCGYHYIEGRYRHYHTVKGILSKKQSTEICVLTIEYFFFYSIIEHTQTNQFDFQVSNEA